LGSACQMRVGDEGGMVEGALFTCNGGGKWWRFLGACRDAERGGDLRYLIRVGSRDDRLGQGFVLFVKKWSPKDGEYLVDGGMCHGSLTKKRSAGAGFGSLLVTGWGRKTGTGRSFALGKKRERRDKRRRSRFH